MKRSSNRLLWGWTGLLSVVSLLIFATGFTLALNPGWLPPQAASRPFAPDPAVPQEEGLDDGVLRLVALGDSLTRGAGDDQGLGYVGRVRLALEQSSDQRVSLTNLAVNGLESGGLLEQLAEKQVQTLVAQADAILFTIGGNDLFRQSGGIYELDEERAANAVDALTARFREILDRIRKLNPQAPIVYVSLYNPFGDTEAAQETNVHILEWNSRAQKEAARHKLVYVVPSFDLFWGREQAHLYSDHYHPNSEGYARIAERVAQLLR